MALGVDTRCPIYNIGTMKTLRDILLSKINKTENGCWEWTGVKTTQGYAKISFIDYVFGGHRIAYEVFRGRIEDNKWVLHTCDNPPCINPDHLYLGNSKDNVSDMISRGRTQWSSKSRVAKITEIRENVGNLTVNELARKYNEPIGTVRLFMMNKTYKNLPVPNFVPILPKPPKPPKIKSLNLDERIERRIERSGECWLWLGKASGVLYLNGKTARHNVQRYLYQKEFGPITERGILLTCPYNKECVRPKHRQFRKTG